MYLFLYKSAQNFSERNKYYNRIFQYLSAVISLFLREIRLKIAKNRPFSISLLSSKWRKIVFFGVLHSISYLKSGAKIRTFPSCSYTFFRKILPLLECLCLYVSLSVYAIILYSVYDSFFMINLYAGTFTALFFTSVSFEGLNIVSTPINVKWKL